MVSRTKQGGTGAALTLVAVLIVGMAPLNLPPADVSLAGLSPDNVYANKYIVKQGEPVQIFLSELLVSDSVGIIYFVFDFHDDSGIYYFNNVEESTRSISHTYSKVGQYDVTVLALRGNISRAFSVPITVIPDDIDLTITANKTSPLENDPIKFSAVIGDHYYTEITQYVWEFGDGEVTTTEEDSISHSYNDSGSYTVKLRAYSNDTIVYTDYYDITVTNRIPGVEIISGSNIKEGRPIPFWAGVKDSTSDLDTLVYIWNFGDGTYQSGSAVSHEYFNEGNYTVTLTVIDNDGAMGVATKTISVHNQAPEVSLVSDKYAYYEGETAITLAKVSDTYNDLPFLKYRWNTESEGQQASIPMLDDGIYTFSVNVSDDNGAWATAETNQINIVNLPPVASLIDAYTEYNITFKIYGTPGVEVNMTLFTDDVAEMNTSLTSYSINPYEANVTSFTDITQNIQFYSDILYYVNNNTASYDNYIVTVFSFKNSENITVINHCQSNKACSSTTWRTPVAPLERGFPITMNFEYFDPGSDDVRVGVDFGTNTVSVLNPANGTANYGLTSITGNLPYGQNPSSIRYWVEDDDGERTEYSLPLLDYASVPRPPGYLNTTFWERWGNTITHYAPGAFISLGTGGFNTSTWDDEVFEGTPQIFNVDPMYAQPAGLSYEWHFGDGTPIVKEKSPYHTYEYSGRYLVWVIMSDGFYESVSYQWIDVINQIQRIEPFIAGNLKEGEELQFTLAGINDDLLYTSNYSILWDFGDGRMEFGTEVSHKYQDAGNFTLTVITVDEHLETEYYSMLLPISPSSPYFNSPFVFQDKFSQGTNLNLLPDVVDSEADMLNLSYSWNINGSTYSSRSLNLNLDPGLYFGEYIVTDSDGLNTSKMFNVTVTTDKAELSMNNLALYGRTIGRTIQASGTISPSISLRYLVSKQRTLNYTLYDKEGGVLDSGQGTISDDLTFTTTIDLEGIYNEDALNSLETSSSDVVDIIATSPQVVSGVYSIVIQLFDDNESVSTITRKLKITADQDGDLLTDELEVLLSSIVENVDLDPLSEDTNDNGISDVVEFLLADDPDNDGLPSILEAQWGSDPRNPDTDGDGLEDGYGKNGMGELTYGTDPTNPDTDGDGLSDYEEIVGWDIYVRFKGYFAWRLKVTSSPLTNDTDSDGVSDYFERTLGANPRSSDTDKDGVSDKSEKERGLALNDFDTDKDWLTDYAEVYKTFSAFWYDVDKNYYAVYYKTNPLSPDTDGDKVSDYWEVLLHTDGTNPDTDSDYVSDWFEYGNRTSPRLADSDGDKLVDGVELAGFEIPLIQLNPGTYDENGNVIKAPSLQNSTILVRTNPLNPDTDGDGLTDYEELMGQSNRISNPTKVDSDGDGMSDSFDPYPLVPDYAPPSIVQNVYGEQGIHLYYKVGENSIVSNVKKTLTASLSAAWQILKGVGNLVKDLISSFFYWKCVQKIFGECVVYVPWINSMSEIRRKVKNAIVSFFLASASRLRQLFSAYDSLGTVIGQSLSFSGFSLSLRKSGGIPVGINIGGLIQLFATTSKRVVKSLVDPTVNVKFTVEDDNMIDKIVVYQNGKYVETINVNAKRYNFDRDYAIIADGGGSTSTTLKFMIYDRVGNVKIIERSDSVVNFIDKVVNQVVQSVKSVIDKIVNWATDILQTAVDAIVDAAQAVVDVAVAIYNAVKDFILNAIPDLFRSFIINTVGKYLQEKYEDSQTAISLITTTYLSQRTELVDFIDSTISSLGIVQGINDSVNELQSLFDEYLPPLDEDAIMEKLSGGSDFLHLNFLDGTIFEYVISFMKDGFLTLLYDVIRDLVEDLAENIVSQYLQPFIDIFDQVTGVFASMGINLDSLQDSNPFDTGSSAIGTIESMVSQVLAFANLLRNPAKTISPFLSGINGENIVKIFDALAIDNPNLFVSLYDIIHAILTPISMLGLVIYDIITWTGSLFSPSAREESQNKYKVLLLLKMARNVKILNVPSAKLDSSQSWGVAVSVIKIPWKILSIFLDFVVSKVIGDDRSDDRKLIQTTVIIEFMFMVIQYIINTLFDLTIDLLYGKPLAGEGSFKEKAATYIMDASAIILRGVFLSVISATCTPSLISAAPPNCKFRFFTPTSYDIFGNILDFLTKIAAMVFNIVDFKQDSGVSTAVFVLKLIVNVLDLIFIPANYITSFGSEISNPYAKAAYYLIYIAKGIIDWVADLIDTFNNWP